MALDATRQHRDDGGMQMDFGNGGDGMDMNFEFNLGNALDVHGRAATPTSAKRMSNTPGSKKVPMS